MSPCPYQSALLAAWAENQDSAHDLAHVLRVWANAQDIAAHEPRADLELLYAATMLHDLVNLPKDAPNRAEASRLSARDAQPIARQAGLPEAKLAALAHAIEAHSFSAGIAPQTLEAKILQDADRLDALGAIGIARMFAVSGALGRPLYDPADPRAQNRALDDTSFAIDHFETKLFQLHETMQTERGRSLAKARTLYMRRFLAELMKDIAP